MLGGECVYEGVRRLGVIWGSRENAAVGGGRVETGGCVERRKWAYSRGRTGCRAWGENAGQTFRGG